MQNKIATNNTLKTVSGLMASQYRAGNVPNVDAVLRDANASNDFKRTYGAYIGNYIHELDQKNNVDKAALSSTENLTAAIQRQGGTVPVVTSKWDAFKTGLKDAGSVFKASAINIGANLAISATIQGIATAFDYVSNKQERAIESGDEVIQNYKDINEQMAQSSSWIETNGEKYTTLSKGVSSLGTNLGLTNEEYAEYQELASQIATQFPELVSGYDSLGKPIIKAATDVDTLKATLKAQKVNQYTESVKNAKDVIDKLNAEVNQDKNWFWEEAGTDQQLQSLEKFQSAYENAFKSKGGNKFLDLNQWLDDGNFVDALDNAGVSVKDFGKLINELNDSQGKLKANSDTNDFLNTIIGSQESLRNQRENSADELKSYIPAFFQEQRAYQNLLDDVPSIDSELTSLINSFSYEDLEKNGFTGDKAISKLKSWSQSAVKELQNKDIQDALNDVFTINDDSSKQSFDSWQKEADATLDKASEKSKSFSREQMRQASGIADQWQNLHDIQTKVAERWNDTTGIKSRDLSIADLETLGTMLSDTQYDGQSFEQMVAQIQNVQDTSRLTLENMKQVVTDTTTAYSSLSTAMSESMSNTGMTADSITAVKTALSSLVSENDAFKDASLDGIFRDTAEGVTMNADAVKTLIKKQRDMKVEDFAKSIRLQNEELAKQNEILKNPESDEAKNAALEKRKQILSDIAGIEQAQSQYNAQYQQMKDMFSDYNQWVLNSSKETAGTPYNNIVSGLEQAYKDFKDGLTGTDSFKSFAAMISPTGATDPADFAENYAKANRYLQEGDEGVKNFLNDLKSHDLAEFNQQTGEWTIKAHNAAEAAEALATGTDVASAAFGKMQDYGLHDNTVDDVQDGVLKLGDAYTKLADSKAKLKEMEENPSEYSDVRIQAQRDEVKAYSQDIEDLSDNMQYYIEHQADEYNKQQQTVKEAIKLMDDYKKEVLANPEKFGGEDNAMGVANYLDQQMQGYADTYGFDLDDMRQKAAQAAVAYQEALKNATIDNPVKPEFDDSATEEVFDSTVSKIQKGQEEVSDAMETLKGFTSDQVKGIDLFDGAYDSDELKPAEQALDTICQSLGLSKDEASQLGQVLEAMGVIKPEVDDSDIEKAGETADTTSEKIQSLKDLQSSGDISSDIELDFDTADMSADELKSKIDELNGLKAEIDAEVNPEASAELDDLISKTETDYKIKVALDTDGQTPSELLDMAQNDEATFKAKFELDDSGYQEALSYLQDKDVEVKVNATLAQGADISSLLNMTDEDLSTTLNIDTSQVDAARAELQSIQNGEITVPLTVKLEDSQFDAITNKNKDVTVTATVNGLPQITALDAALNKLHNKSVDVTANVNGTSETNALYSAIQRVNSKSVDVTANVSGTDAVNALVSAIAGVHSKTVTITSNHVTNNITNNIKGKGAQATGTMTSISRTRAYAFGSLDNFDFSPAYANGKISVDHDQVALMNELGMESRVRDGVWSLIPGGAHFENVKKDDIIFSAKQTQDLLKYGATSGHARAYAQGSLSDISLSNAFGLGSFKFSQDQPYTNKTSVSSGSSSSSDSSATQQHTDAVKDDTSATEDNTKSAKDSTEAFDWVKTKLDKFAKSVERISNQITDYISSTFKTVLLKRQVKAVEKQLKANEQGYTAYMNKANSVDISDDYKNKVINGTFSIEEIDTSSDSGKQLAKDIKSFQTYYNSAQDCKDTVQELNNKLLELYETIVNMPTEKAEKKIDRLKTKLESLNAVSDTVSLGGSAIAAMQNQIKVDNPGLGNAQKKLDKAETARNATKKTRAKASKTLKSATADAESTGNTLIKESEKQRKSIGKKLKSAAKSSTNKATYNAIAQAVREGKAVNTKGLKGSALKYAKSYNSSLKQGNTIASKVKAGKTVKTSGMSNILKSTAQAYNADAREKASAQKIYDNAKKADEKALDDLTKAQKNKEKLYAGSTKEQQILATTKGKKSYVYQNMLLTQETKNLKEQNKHRQKALKETRDSYLKAKSKSDTADADKTKSQKKLLNNKTVMSKLNKTQQKALKAGKTVSTKGITDSKVLKWIQDYNEKVKKSADLSKKLRIEEEALTKAQNEAAQSQAEYAQSIVENAKKKLENIANYYDSFTSQWENRNSMYEAYMDRMQTQGYNLSTKFYEAEIGQQQKIVDNLSQKYIAMKRNFANLVADPNSGIKEGTEEYYEMQNEIDQVAISLKEAQNKVVEFQASIRDLKWEQFDQLQEAIGRITSESDFLIDLMSHKDMYDKDGNMTEQGLATMGLHGVNYNTYMAQADKYKEEMLKISEELANDPNNQKLIDRKNELIDAQQQAILSAENEKDSIKDLIQDGIDKQLDALDDLIDKYLDCLDSEKSLYEYRKKIGEQSEKIASLQKQLSSLQGDNSEEAKAKLQKLKEDLKSAQDDMEETQYDKYISDQKKLLDELKQDYKKALDDRMDNVDVLISDAIASINSNSSNISQTLQTESKNVGYTLSGEMQTIWTSQSQALSMYDGKFDTRFTGVTTAIGNVYDRQKDMIDAINAMAEKWIAKADQMLQQPTKTEGVLEEVEQKPDKDNVAEGNPTPDPPKVSDDESIRDAVLVDPDEPKKKPNKDKTGNGKAEVGDKVTYVSGRYYGDSDGGHGSGNYYLGKKVKITRINKGSKYPYAIDATDGTELGWVKLNQLKGYASGIMRVPNDQLAWTQEQGEEAIVRNDGSILTPLSRDVSVLNADMTKNLWDFMGNPGSFLSDYSDGEKFGVKNVDNSSSVDVGGVTIQCNMPNVQNANDLLHELTTNKDIEKAICAMTIGRAMGGSSLAKYKYKK